MAIMTLLFFDKSKFSLVVFADDMVCVLHGVYHALISSFVQIPEKLHSDIIKERNNWKGRAANYGNFHYRLIC